MIVAIIIVVLALLAAIISVAIATRPCKDDASTAIQTEKEKKRPRTRAQKGDISNEVRKGTFLSSFDNPLLEY